MATVIKNVIVIGGNGTIGAPILKALEQSSKFNVSVLARPESTNKYSDNIKVVVSDYSEASLIAAFKGQDAVVSVLGFHGLKDELKIIDAAAAAGVKRFLPSQFGNDPQNAPTVELLSIFQLKVQAVEKLRGYEASGMSWTAIPTGPSWDLGLQIGLIGFNINDHTAIILNGGNKKVSSSTNAQVGNAVVAVLSKPEETANQFTYLDSFTATQNEILAELEKATGKKWDVTHTTTKESIAKGGELMGVGDFSGLMYLLRAVCLGEQFNCDYSPSLANEKLGLARLSLEEAVATGVAKTA